MFDKLWRMYLRWHTEREPVICYVCNGKTNKKKVAYENTIFGTIVPLCPNCHLKMFGEHHG
jgi:hypothetical protein